MILSPDFQEIRTLIPGRCGQLDSMGQGISPLVSLGTGFLVGPVARGQRVLILN